MSKTINQDNLNASLRMLDKMGEANLEQLKRTDPALAERMEQLGALSRNEDFCKQFLSCPDKQAAVRLFADHGLVLTEDEVEMLALQINSLTKKLMENDGTLSEEELEQISGGNLLDGICYGTAGGLAFAAAGAAIGTLFCPGLGSIIGAVIGGLGGALGWGLGTGLSD